MTRWLIECTKKWEDAKVLAAAGWEPYAVTEEPPVGDNTFGETWHFFRKPMIDAEAENQDPA